VPPNDVLAEFGLVNVEQAVRRIFFDNAAHFTDLDGLRFRQPIHIKVGSFHVGAARQQRPI
jgi:hypothetical protein